IIRFFVDEISNQILLSQDDLVQKLKDLDENSVFVLDDCDQEIDPEFTLEVFFADSCAEGYFERRNYSWIATDVCGNADSVSFSIDIIDDMPPIFPAIPNDTVIVCDQLPTAPVLLALDGAQPVTMTYSETITPEANPGEFMVVRKAVAMDACGNISESVQTVIWMPETLLECSIILPDAVECNSHGVVINSDIAGGIDPLSYFWEITGDKCFIQGGQNTPEILIYVGFSDVEITLTVTDSFGCRTMCFAVLSCNGFTEGLGINSSQVLNAESIDGQVKPLIGSGNDSDLKSLTNFNLWPNPAKESINLSFDSSIDYEAQVTLTDFLGQNILNNKIQTVKGINNSKIDIAQIPQGSYILQVKTNNEIYTKVVVIMRN
ncbi:MAG: T9SS type A sorting domain-containing protein, partial [Saprospiraceae bacterium]